MNEPNLEYELANEQLTEEFLDKYKQLEEAAKRVYGLSETESVMRYLESSGAFSRYATELDYCREVRNLLQHRPKLANAYAVTPSAQMIKLLDQLIARLENRTSVMQIAVLWAGIYWCSKTADVLTALSVMRDKNYSAVPLIEDRRVIGVFDGVALASYLADCKGESWLSKGLKFEDIESYLALDAHDTEVYLFVPRSMYAEDLEDLFEEQFRRGKRVEIAFITEHGRPEESVLGMVTAWDLLVKID